MRSNLAVDLRRKKRFAEVGTGTVGLVAMVSRDGRWVIQPRRGGDRRVYEVRYDGWLRKLAPDLESLREYLEAHGVDLADLEET